MKNIQVLRNVGIFGHGKCGKTSLAEALLFTAGKTTRLGKVDDGSSCMDFEPEEIQRHLSIGSSFNQLTWNKNEIFITDTPGEDNFLNDAVAATQVVDSAIFTIGAVLGVKHLTVRIADFLAEAGLPTLIFINKMDRERANFERTMSAINESLPIKAAVIQLPIGSENNFKGVIDLVNQDAYMFDGQTGKVSKALIPKEMADDVELYRESLMEMVAETDDDLIEKFLEEGELSDEDLKMGLSNAIKSAKLCPVLTGAATANLGTELLLNAIIDLLPSPAERPAFVGTSPQGDVQERESSPNAPFSALVFKTTADPYAGKLTLFRVMSGTLAGDTFHNSTTDTTERFGQLLTIEGKESKPVKDAVPGMIVAVAKLKNTSTGDTLCAAANPIIYKPKEAIKPAISYAVSTTKREDEDKLFSSISKMLDEDPTLKLTRETQTNEILISGIGQMHLTIVGEKIKRKYGVEMALRIPKVPYKETIKGSAKVQYRHKKQSGGKGQFADNWLEIEPLPQGGGYEFVDKIVGGVIPKQYIPAVDKGVQEAMTNGILAGYPVVDIKVTLFDGSFHNVDSSEMAFKIAGSMAFKKGALEAKPVLLEPVMFMTIQIPKDCVGDVIGDINSRRGKVMGMDSEQKLEVITAQVPMAEIMEYAPDLTSITGGRGFFTTEFSHYEEVPSHLTDGIIAASKG
jgi:elongation factor G